MQANVSNGNIETGQFYPFRLTWDAASNTLEVYFNEVLRQTLALDLANNIFNGNPLVNWGWTGTTGGATNVHTFCLENAYYSTHIEAVTATPEGPWQVCDGQELTLTAFPLPPAATATWVANGAAELTLSTGGTYVPTPKTMKALPTRRRGRCSRPQPNPGDPEAVCDDPSTVLLGSIAPGATLPKAKSVTRTPLPKTGFTCRRCVEGVSKRNPFRSPSDLWSAVFRRCPLRW